jgi:hypothetical protein
MRATTPRPPQQQSAPGRPRARRAPRKGAIVVLTAFLLIIMMGMVAFSVDLGYMYTMQSQLQRSVDAAALAGAGALVDGQDSANERVIEYLVRNPVGAGPAIGGNGDLESQISQFASEHSSDLDVQLGHWDADTRVFTQSDDLPSTISVSMTYPNNPLFFARFLGEKEFAISAKSVAMYQPRDILVVLDFSASMNDDTEFTAIPTLTRAVVEANLQQCWTDLGSPTYGNMTFEPKYITVTAAGSSPTVTAEYRYTSTYVTSTHTLTEVRLTFSNGNTQTWNNPGGTTGTFQGSGSNSGKSITQVRVKANSKTRTIDFNSDDIDDICKSALGLNSATYPYSYGSWDSYIDWCQANDEQNDDYGGYRWKFGYMSLMVYWLEKYPENFKNPDLWKVSAQPVTALKNATDAFMDFIQEVDTDDRVGLAIYNASDGEGYLESGLTHDLDSLVTIVQHRQAGHYHQYTNIGGGLKAGREELEANGRPGAFKMVVLMTDGKANWTDGEYDEDAAADFLLAEAQLCADKRFPILAVSLGSGADTSIMQQVADLTPDGRHFNVPGGQTGAQYYADLLDVFREIAKHRPLKLVK